MGATILSSPPSRDYFEGLSSPFRDRPAIPLLNPLHVVDVSPTPSLPEVRGRQQKFGGAPSQEHNLMATEQIEDFTIYPTVKVKASHQAVGLGLGIHTGESTLESLMEASRVPTQELRTRGHKFGHTFKLNPIQLSRRRVKMIRVHSRADCVPKTKVHEDHGYLAEDEKDDGCREATHTFPAFRGSKLNIEASDDLDESLKERTSTFFLKNPFRAPRLLSKKGLRPAPDPPIGLYLEREKQPNYQGLHENHRALPLSSAMNTMDFLSPYRNKPSSSENLRSRAIYHGIYARGSDETANSAVNPPNDPTTARNHLDDQVAPKLSTFASFPEPTSTSPLSATASVPKSESPLLMPTSPGGAIRSPAGHDAPGGFSPSLYEATSPVPSPALNTAQAHDVSTGHDATPYIFSLLAGSLGIFGICCLVAFMLWKKNINLTKIQFWRRKPRGTAYDEFMEEEKNWRLGLNTAGNYSKTQTDINAQVSDHEEEKGTACKFVRSPSQAPSIPPLAHIVDGKMSFDTIRIDLLSRPCSLKPLKSSDDPDSGEEISNKKDVLSENPLATQSSTAHTAGPNQVIKLSDPKKASRSRSGSKSSNFSKVSKKSMESITSILSNRTKFESLIGSKKKMPVNLGISNKNYENHASSLKNVGSKKDPPTLHSGQSSPAQSLIGLGFDFPEHKEYNEENIQVSTEPAAQKSSRSPTSIKPEVFSRNSEEAQDNSRILDRPAAIHIERSFKSSQARDIVKRRQTLTLAPPSILITDHPSALIPPSPRPLTTRDRPGSAGTILTSYSDASYSSDHNTWTDNYPDRSRYSASSFSKSCPPSMTRDSFSPEEPFVSRQSTSIENLEASESGRVASLSNLLLRRGRYSEVVSGQRFEQNLSLKPQLPDEDRCSLGSMASSKTIRELAAVTEDLRALIDADVNEDYSCRTPSQFHVSVQGRGLSRVSNPVVPPKRPPKSANRYIPKERSSAKYESSSTPSLPIHSSEFDMGEISIQSTDLDSSDWSLDAIQSPSKPYYRSQKTTFPEKPSNIRWNKSGSGSSLETVISTESSGSIFEAASLHTAQAVRGASAEFVFRAPQLYSHS